MELKFDLESTVYKTLNFVTTLAFLAAYYPKDAPLLRTNFIWLDNIIFAIRSGVELTFTNNTSKTRYREIINHLISQIDRHYTRHISSNRIQHPIFSMVIKDKHKAISLITVENGQLSSLSNDSIYDAIASSSAAFIFDEDVDKNFKIHLLIRGNLLLDINRKLPGRADAATILEEVILAVSQHRLELSDASIRIGTIFKEDTLAQAINRFRTSLKTNYNLQCDIPYRKGSKSVFDIRSLGFSVLILKSPTGA